MNAESRIGMEGRVSGSPILHSSFRILHFPRYDPSALATRKLHIFAAIHVEATAIRPILPDGVELTVIGIRAVRLPRQIDARAIIMAGFAGALDPALAIGDIVRDDPPGMIFSSPDIVSTPRDKAELFWKSGARAVDMENAIVRDFARRAGVPFFGVRAISDTADESIDPRLLDIIDDVGRPIPTAIARALVRNPGLLIGLNRLRINSAIAGRALATAVKTLLQENNGL